MSKKGTSVTLAVVAAMVAAGGRTSSAHAEDDLVRVSDAAKTWTSLAVMLLMLFGVSLTSAVAGAEPSADVFRSVVTAENLDLGQTAEFPANPELQTLEAAQREAFFLSLLGVRGSREESRGGWRTGATEERQRHLRVAFKEPLPVGTILGAGGAVSYLKPERRFRET